MIMSNDNRDFDYSQPMRRDERQDNPRPTSTRTMNANAESRPLHSMEPLVIPRVPTPRNWPPVDEYSMDLPFDISPSSPYTMQPRSLIFPRAIFRPENPRLRTAQACEKCRSRKAKCSGTHPTCARCKSRGFICEYAKEGRVRGPNRHSSHHYKSGSRNSSDSESLNLSHFSDAESGPFFAGSPSTAASSYHDGSLAGGGSNDLRPRSFSVELNSDYSDFRKRQSPRDVDNDFQRMGSLARPRTHSNPDLYVSGPMGSSGGGGPGRDQAIRPPSVRLSDINHFSGSLSDDGYYRTSNLRSRSGSDPAVHGGVRPISMHSPIPTSPLNQSSSASSMFENAFFDDSSITSGSYLPSSDVYAPQPYPVPRGLYFGSSNADDTDHTLTTSSVDEDFRNILTSTADTVNSYAGEPFSSPPVGTDHSQVQWNAPDYSQPPIQHHDWMRGNIPSHSLTEELNMHVLPSMPIYNAYPSSSHLVEGIDVPSDTTAHLGTHNYALSNDFQSAADPAHQIWSVSGDDVHEELMQYIH